MMPTKGGAKLVEVDPINERQDSEDFIFRFPLLVCLEDSFLCF